MEVVILKDINIAFDGINARAFTKGEKVSVTEFELQRLIHYGVVELSKPQEPDVKKVVEVEVKKAKKKGK